MEVIPTYCRQIYIDKLLVFRENTELIKVITGIRRCGKSTLMELLKEKLLSEGIPQSNIFHMNFESLDYDEIRNYKQLYNYINEKITNQNIYYLLLDEVQQINEWERAVNSLRLKGNIDIYITSSNADLLSSEISTLLSGRYVEIKMLPLSFQEFMEFNNHKEGDSLDKWFEKYLTIGGFPGISKIQDKPDTIEPFLNGIFNTVIVKDVVQRNEVRDVALLENLVRFMADNIGNSLSTKKISDYLTSAGRKTTSETIDSYIRMLEDAFVFYRIKRYDIKGKLYLKTQEKYYLVDQGLRQVLLKRGNYDYGHLLENVVYFELLRRGYEVSIGKVGAFEVDFLAEKAGLRIYYQVSASILDDTTRERELRPLRSIHDYYEKVILSMDHIPVNNFDGIKHQNIIDFLIN
jgi:Predicted ATPase (AAA+ superfamily)